MEIVLLLTSTSSASSNESNQNGDVFKKFLNIFTNPVFYIVLAIIFALVIIYYFLKRIVVSKPNHAIVVLRNNKVYKIVDEGMPRYYLAPFIDSIGAIIRTSNNEFSSDKLFINNGPDRLYRINYTFSFKVVNAESYYHIMNNAKEEIEKRINDILRTFADEGNVAYLIDDYKNHCDQVLTIINKSLQGYGIEALDFKTNYIEPLGSKK